MNLPASSPAVVVAVPRMRVPRRLVIFAASFGVLLVVALVGLLGTGYRYRPLRPSPVATAPTSGDEVGAVLARERKERRKLESALAKVAPSGPYIVIDRTHNRLSLRQGDEVLLDATCSAGSGKVLREPNGERVWVFDTPRGVFRVRSKIADPVWKKPDWAFIEEGQPIPRNPGDRIEYGALGEYALYFGDGYMIHGTLYERLLGRAVSHGCIRLGRDDLRAVYRASKVGTPIYVF
jgi:L,D-transpeptidase YbiS